MNSLSSKQKPISHLLLSFYSPSSKFISFSHFSSSSSSSSSSHHSNFSSSSESRNVGVSVWWDIENCGVPTGINVFRIAQHITHAVRVNGIKGPVHISAFGDVLCLSRPNQEALSSTGINLIHVPQGGKNSADRSLLVDLMCWVSQNPPPAHIFLISGDRDFSSILHKLRMNNYNILLAGREINHTPGVLCSAASIMWHWNELVKGENLSGRHFNQPPDGPFNSWYGHYRGPLEDPFAFTSDLNAEVSSDQPISVPKTVLKQIHQIVNSYPNGLSATELRVEMAKNNVNIHKSFYGYKRFSRFLTSMPQILKVVSGSDGQLMIHPISLKPPRDPAVSVDNSSGTMTQNRKRDVEVTRKTEGGYHPITRMVEYESKLPTSSRNGVKEKNIEDKVEEISDKASDAPGKDKVAPMKETNTLDTKVTESHTYPIKAQDPKDEMGFFRRLWTKWFAHSIKVEKSTPSFADKPCAASVSKEKSISEEGPTSTANQHDIHNPSNMGPELDKNGKSEVISGFVTKVLSWLEPWKTNPSVNTVTEHSTKEPSSVEDLKYEDTSLSMNHGNASQSMKLEDAQEMKKHELFSKEAFWSAFESFLRTYKAADIILNSTSREELARRLKDDGPLDLQSLLESDLLHLVDILISEKKWIKEFPTKSPRFRLHPSPGKSITSVQPHHSDEVRFLSSSFSHKKPLERSRTQILADCQKLLDELLKQYPEGFNMGVFKKQFLDKYEYVLDHQKLGYPKLVYLLQRMPGVKIESCQVLPNNVVYSPGIRSSGSDSDMSDSPVKGEDVESPWEELGPVDKLSKKDEEPGNQVNPEYESSVLDNNEFSDTEEDRPTSRSTMIEDSSSLVKILNAWYSKEDETRDLEKEHISYPESLVDCSKEKVGTSEASSAAKNAQKPAKSYMFVADPVDGVNLFDDILGKIKKSDETKMPS